MLARPNLSADGLGASKPGDVSLLARVAADELARRYPPAHTHLALARVPGTFGEALETDLRSRGYAVADNVAGALAVQYTVDALDELDSNFIGEFGRSAYVRVKVSDGQEFSFVRKLGAIMPVTPVDPLIQLATPSKADLTPEKKIQTTPLGVTELQPSPLPAASSAPAPVAPDSQIHPVKAVKGTPTKLSTGVLTSLPSNWRYTIPQAEFRSVRVSKSDTLPWRESIQNMAEQAGCAASFDESARRVTLIAYDDADVADDMDDAPVPAAFAEAPAESGASPSAVPSAVIPPAGPAAGPATLSTSSVNSPVVSTALTEVSLPTSVVPAASLSAITSPLSPLSPSVAEEWKLAPGSLESQLRGWASRAQWELLWKAEHDIMLHSHAILRGSFTDVVAQLFQGLSIQGNSLRITFYSVNNVVEVKED